MLNCYYKYSAPPSQSSDREQNALIKIPTQSHPQLAAILAMTLMLAASCQHHRNQPAQIKTIYQPSRILPEPEATVCFLDADHVTDKNYIENILVGQYNKSTNFKFKVFGSCHDIDANNQVIKVKFIKESVFEVAQGAIALGAYYPNKLQMDKTKEFEAPTTKSVFDLIRDHIGHDKDPLVVLVSVEASYRLYKSQGYMQQKYTNDEIFKRTRRLYDRIILHEFGHAIGLAHEQYRPENDSRTECSYSFANPEYRENEDLEVIKQPDGQELDYDSNSIMHYCAPQTDGYHINYLTSSDRYTINSMYPVD